MVVAWTINSNWVVKAQGEEDLTFKRYEETLMYKITYKIDEIMMLILKFTLWA